MTGASNWFLYARCNNSLDTFRGGVTALEQVARYPVYADETIQLFELLSISAGARGTQILIAPDDYLRVTHATVVAIAKEKLRSS